MDARYNRMINIGIKLLIVVSAVLALFYIGLPVARLLLPFIIATIVAILMEPLVRFMQKRLKMGRKLASVLSLLSVLVVFGTLISLLIYKIVIELTKLSSAVPESLKALNLNNEALYWTNLGQKLYLSIPPQAAELIQTRLNQAISEISSYLSTFFTTLLSFVLDLIKFFPQSFIFIIITIVSIYFMSSDKEKIRGFIFRQFPDNWAPKISGLKNDLLYALVGFLKAQLMLISITIVIATTGLSLLRVEYALTLGLLIGFAEIIPVVGTGSIFLPWIVYELITRNNYLALGLLATFVLGVVVRQLMEPKILGTTIGINPLLALISIYIGLETLGVFGMILGPITVIVLMNLNKSGVIRLWKE